MTKDQIKECVKNEYLSGIDGYTIAEKYNFSYRTIYKWLEQANIPRRNPRFKKGSNSWSYFTEEDAVKRRLKLSSAMRKSNPMKREDVRLNKHIRYVKVGVNTLISSYLRKKTIRDKKKCKKCKTKYPLIVHHKDNNRFNNNGANLMVLCHNCHFLLHEKERLNGRKNLCSNDTISNGLASV